MVNRDSLVIAFNDTLDPSRALNPAAYVIRDSQGHRVDVSRVIYDPTNNSVAVFPDRLLNFHYPFTVMIMGTGASALKDSAGRALDGAGTGRPGTDYQAKVTWRNLVYPGNPPAWMYGSAERTASQSPSDVVGSLSSARNAGFRKLRSQ
jgi:hypothetical protein